MKIRMFLIACAGVAFAGAAMASSDAPPPARILPVVVNVDAQGHVTEILPAVSLRQTYHDSLMKQLAKWITKPAMSKNGKAIASRFLLEVAVNVTQRPDKTSALTYTYVKAVPIPFGGPLHWNVIDNGRNVALVSDSGPSLQFPHDEMQTATANSFFQSGGSHGSSGGGNSGGGGSSSGGGSGGGHL